MQSNDDSRKPVTTNLSENQTEQQESSPDTSLEPLLEEIRRKHGKALLAILVYGSWLRGKRDTMLDFYVLVEDYHTLDSPWQGWMCKLLPPNVYHIHHKANEPDTQRPDTVRPELRAKYALLTLKRFRHAMEYDFHSYFWARFSQPCKILYARDNAAQLELEEAFSCATATFIQRVLPAMGDGFTSNELWTHGLSLTYQCELRTESSNRGESIYKFNPDYYDGVTNTFALNSNDISGPQTDSYYGNESSTLSRKLSGLSWWFRRAQGKLLSVLRLGKAAFTFNEPLEYLLWKIERHSGVYIQPSQRQLNHPLIFAWPLLWKLYRRGAFR